MTLNYVWCGFVVATGWFKNLYSFLRQVCQDVGLGIKPICSSCTGIC